MSNNTQVATSKPAAGDSGACSECGKRQVEGFALYCVGCCETINKPAAASGEAANGVSENRMKRIDEVREFALTGGHCGTSSVSGDLFTTPPAQAPAELTFATSGEKMFFAVGNQRFVLDYEPDSDEAFKYMADMLTKAIRRAQLPATGEALTVDQKSALMLNAAQAADNAAEASQYELSHAEINALTFDFIIAALKGGAA